MQNRLLFILIIFLSAPGDLASDVRFFPSVKLVQNPHSSLLRSPSIDVLYIHSADDNTNYMGYNFGSKIPMLSIHRDNSIQYQFGGFGGVFTRFELFSESFNFVHADFLGGVFWDAEYDSLSFETMLYHVSSHIGDDYIYYENAEILDVGFEAVRHYTNLKIIEMLIVSIGFEYKFSRRPNNIIFYNKSFLAGSKIDLYSKGMPLFLECELEIIGMDHSPNVGIRLGTYLGYLFNNILLNDERQSRELHEFSIYYYYGYSKMGYFYDKKESLLLLGPTYRF